MLPIFSAFQLLRAAPCIVMADMQTWGARSCLSLSIILHLLSSRVQRVSTPAGRLTSCRGRRWLMMPADIESDVKSLDRRVSAIPRASLPARNI